MKRLLVLGFATAAVSAACSDNGAAPASGLAITMASAYSAAPAGFSELNTSFDASPSGDAFMPMFDHGHGMGGGMMGFGPPGGGPGFGIGFMGGGLMGPFMGDDVGHFFHDDQNCTFSSSTGQVTCSFTTRDGLTVTRVSKYTTASGAVQQARDSLTNTIATSTTVSGTATHRDSSKSVVDEKSNQTLTGVAKSSTKRTVDGTSAGTETTTGTSSQGAFTAKRVTGDTVKGVVIPTPANVDPRTIYPTAGTVTRSMTATVTITGQSPTTSTRREVVTYDGSATAKVVITQDGKTQNCTLPLPHGRLTCS